MKYVVNIEDIENALVLLGGEAQAKQIQDKILKLFCKDEIPENYAHEKSFRQTIQRKMEDYCPQAEGFNPIKKEAKFLRVGHGVYRTATKVNIGEFHIAEEVPEYKALVEGAVKEIKINAYERNEKARQACIKHYGLTCLVCGFNFENAYGEIGKNFIHVHHIKPLAEIQKSYVVDPVKDLVPICANCHAVVHRVEPPLAINVVKEILTSRSIRKP